MNLSAAFSVEAGRSEMVPQVEQIAVFSQESDCFSIINENLQITNSCYVSKH